MNSSPAIFLATAAALLLIPRASAQEPVDLTAINRLRLEEARDPKVMDHLFQLTDVNGQRLTNSPGYFTAAGWAAKRMQEYGLKNVHLEKWGPFGRSWTLKRFSAEMTAPAYMNLTGVPMAWSASTGGTVTGEPILIVLKTDEDLAKQKGKLAGKIIMVSEVRPTPPVTTPLAGRESDATLEKLSALDDLSLLAAGDRDTPQYQEYVKSRKFRAKLVEFLASEKPALVLCSSYRADGGTVFATSFGDRNEKHPVPPPAMTLGVESYNRIARLLEKKVPVSLAVNIDSEILPATESVNVVGEIPGTDKANELVLLGGHLDSWHGGTGATDDAAGCGVALEAVRLITKLEKKPRRTIRIVLWSGEEQGLLGSKAYVKTHFADPEVLQLSAEHAQVSGYFNLDNGTGKIRGIYLQGNDLVRPIFEAWLAPFKDLGATTLSPRNTGGTDHLSFDAVGLPGFQFIQDPIEYDTRTHHSNMDVYDHLSKPDLMQASVIMASFAYHTAMRDEKLPRKPMPPVQPKQNEFGEEEKASPASKPTTAAAAN